MSESPVPRFRSAALWSYGQTIGKMGMTTLVSLVLAAILGPRAYGTIAMALVFTNFIEMLQQQGMMPAIISQRNLDDEHADTAFWLVLAISLVGTSLGVLVAPGWAELNRTPELRDVIRVLAITIPLSASAVVHEAMLRRELAFKQLAIRTWVSVALGGAAGLAAALLGWGVWALVAQHVVMSSVSTLALWLASPWRPRWRFNRSAAKQLWSYSLRSAASSLGVFVGGRVDVLLAGLLFGPQVVGLYRLGQRVTSTVVDVAARAMQSVSLPVLAKVQDQHKVFVARLLGMQRTTAILALPALGLVFGVAPDIQAALGAEWAGTTPVIRILVVGQMLVSMVVLLGPALQAVGRPGVLAVILWLWSGVAIVAILGAGQLASDQDIAALCWAVVIGNGAAAALHVGAAVGVLGVPLGGMARAWAPGLVAGMVAMGTTTVLTGLLDLGHPLLDLLGSLSAGAIVVALGVVAVDAKARRAFGGLLRRLRRGPQGGVAPPQAD